MQRKLPYYMAFPTPSIFGDEKVEERDLEYLRSLYPYTIKKVLFFVEAECDDLEYEGSMIYDEYPDQLQLHMICDRICDKVRSAGSDEWMMEDEMEMQQRGRRRRYDDPLRGMVQVLLSHELLRRRRDRRRRRNRFY